MKSVLKIAIFDAKSYDRVVFDKANQDHFDLVYIEAGLDERTLQAARGCEVVCSFVNDRLNRENLKALCCLGIRFIALRSAGFNHIDLGAAEDLGLPVVRVPEYSPYSVAEHAVALLLSLNRKIHRAYSRVRELNFSLEGLLGFDLHGKAVGVVGTGRIGRVFCQIMHGFGCRILAYDLQPDKDLGRSAGVQYVALNELLKQSDVISLHVPLTPQTRHLIDAEALNYMKPGVFLINTGRGALVDSKALVSALKNHRIGAAGLDVYEEEEGVFFHDSSESGIADDTLARLLTFPNVLITGHQGFFTTEALNNIAKTTIENILRFERGEPLQNTVG